MLRQNVEFGLMCLGAYTPALIDGMKIYFTAGMNLDINI